MLLRPWRLYLVLRYGGLILFLAWCKRRRDLKTWSWEIKVSLDGSGLSSAASAASAASYLLWRLASASEAPFLSLHY
jgi:hypothetical protein